MSPNATEAVVRSMLSAVHRRDHAHPGECCHPHQVEVVHFGPTSIAVCHDCGFESEFAPMRDCEQVAGAHRSLTA
jgi:hypothetical protein